MTGRILADGAILRAAASDDAPGILSCIQALAVYEREPDAVENTVEALTETLFGAEPRAFAHVVERDGEVKAIAVWFLTYSTWTGRHGIWLEDLFVDPEARGLGVGKALLVNLAQRCVWEGLGRFEWWVLDWNEPSIAFYKSQGGVMQDEWTKVRVDGEALARLGAP